MIFGLIEEIQNENQRILPWLYVLKKKLLTLISIYLSIYGSVFLSLCLSLSLLLFTLENTSEDLEGIMDKIFHKVKKKNTQNIDIKFSNWKLVTVSKKIVTLILPLDSDMLRSDFKNQSNFWAKSGPSEILH